ncbi:MAG: inositol monophosphatase family protein [Bacteroidales bacterium]
MDLKSLTLQVCSLAKATGAIIQQAVLNKEDIEEKSSNNFVTWVDKSAEIFIVNGLQKILPGSGFIGEEDTLGNSMGEYTWIIDPLDGTTNYIHGIPLYCVSIGLMHNNAVISGVIYEVTSGECFYAWKDGGAYLDGNRIYTSGTPRLKDALLATGFPYYDYGRLDEYLALFRHLMQHSHGLRRLGSAAADLAWVACGRFDGFYEYGLSPWDVAAGSLLVSEAGGRVCDFKGGQEFLFGKEIVVANSKIFEELKEVIQDFFGIS